MMFPEGLYPIHRRYKSGVRMEHATLYTYLMQDWATLNPYLGPFPEHDLIVQNPCAHAYAPSGGLLFYTAAILHPGSGAYAKVIEGDLSGNRAHLNSFIAAPVVVPAGFLFQVTFTFDAAHPDNEASLSLIGAKVPFVG